MPKGRSLLTVVFLACMAAGAGRSDASVVAADFTVAFERSPVPDSNYGWQFTVNAPIVIDGLGFWDHGSNGLVDPHEVGIWTDITTAPLLIASEDINNNDSIPVASTSSSGRWLFSNIAPLTLPPGTYIIGAVYRAGPTGLFDPFVSDASMVNTVPEVTFQTPRLITGTQMLTCPTQFGLNEHNGFFGPNFRVVPEPSALALLVAIAGFGCAGRRRSAA